VKPPLLSKERTRRHLKTGTEGAQTTSSLRLFQASIHLLAKLKSRQFTRLNCFLSLNLLPRVQELCNVKKELLSNAQ